VMYDVTRSTSTAESKRRHYKKDSRYLLDLYTLTFDENETVDEIEVRTNRQIMTQLAFYVATWVENVFMSAILLYTLSFRIYWLDIKAR
jgi:hypothetical protein